LGSWHRHIHKRNLYEIFQVEVRVFGIWTGFQSVRLALAISLFFFRFGVGINRVFYHSVLIKRDFYRAPSGFYAIEVPDAYQSEGN